MRNPKDDVIQAWVTGRYVQYHDHAYRPINMLTSLFRGIITDDMARKITAARDQCLGNQEELTRNKPVVIGGVYQGGIAFERNNRAKAVKEGTRCYTIGNSYESPTQIMAPCAPGKMLGEMDKAQRMRQNLLRVRACVEFLLSQFLPSDLLRLYLISPWPQ